VTLEVDPAPAGAPSDWPSPLYHLTLAVAAATRPDDIVEAAITCLHEAIGVDRSSVLLFDKEGVMRFRAWRNLSDAYRSAVDGHSPWSRDTTDATPVLVEDVRTDPSLAALRDTIEGEGIRALAFIPLLLGTRLLGKFMLYYDAPHVFTDREVLVAQTIAAHVAFAIDQHAHRETERRYHDLLQTLGVAVYTTDAAGRITYYNEEATELWGRSPRLGVDQWSGSQRLYRPDGTDLPLDQCPMAIALREGRPVRGSEAVVERPDGTRRHFIPYPTPLFDDDGRLTGAVNVLVDITERRIAEAALEDKEARLVAAIQEQQSLLAARDETITLYELVQAQLTSLIEATSALISSADGESVVPSILEIAAQLLGADAYAMWRYMPDRERWEITASRGLSREYLATSQLEAGGERRLAQAMVVEDVFADSRLADFRERYTSEGVRSMFVAPLPIGIGENGTLTFYYRQPHRFSDLEVRVGVALANLAASSMASARLLDANVRSRADLQRANAQLEATADELRTANAAKDEFLSLVSHELKTPLTTIRGNAEVLSRGGERLDDETRSGALADILAESERLHRIIENLLLLARAERGQDLQSEPLLVIRVVNRVLARHRKRYPGRVFEVLEHGDPRPVVFSEDFLEQVFENLVSNAEKYSPSDQPILVEFRREPHEVQLRVLDRGIGIDEAEQPRLFTPFYRSLSSSHRAEGLGIGLAVCKRLVEAQGGRMWAANRAGGGSEFGFALPITDADLPDLYGD
jgi:PAS domain S-box-containing protein